ncbi:hypothetical protein R1sor_001218 [Riccia sorocarpa]|uniref:Uncharacterized protein n=1 Tax=Riccia sorocarpa TaxID=122646 RepID=A0ABD3GX05_9MARC
MGFIRHLFLTFEIMEISARRSPLAEAMHSPLDFVNSQQTHDSQSAYDDSDETFFTLLSRSRPVVRRHTVVNQPLSFDGFAKDLSVTAGLCSQFGSSSSHPGAAENAGYQNLGAAMVTDRVLHGAMDADQNLQPVEGSKRQRSGVQPSAPVKKKPMKKKKKTMLASDDDIDGENCISEEPASRAVWTIAEKEALVQFRGELDKEFKASAGKQDSSNPEVVPETESPNQFIKESLCSKRVEKRRSIGDKLCGLLSDMVQNSSKVAESSAEMTQHIAASVQFLDRLDAHMAALVAKI